MKKSGIDAHQLKKDFLGNKAKISQYDLYKDTKTGEILILPKGGQGKPIKHRQKDRLNMTTKTNLITTIFGEEFDPNRISKLTGINPTSIRYKGDKIRGYSNLYRKETCWEYSFGYKKTLNFSNISNLFVKKFKNQNKLFEYIKECSLETKIYIVPQIYDGVKPGLHFDKEFMELIVKMNGRINIDMYIY